MNWLYSTQYFESPTQGRIKVRRFLGKYTLSVHGESESSPYTDAMWQHALKRITKHARIKHILLFGLGAGSTLRAIDKKYPHSHVTVLEWDKTMWDICKAIGLISRPESTEVVIGDARETIKTLPKKFDLIIFDLFTGNKISESVIDKTFLSDISNHLAPNGYYLVNYWLGGKHSSTVEQYFTPQATWYFRINKLGLYRPALPTGYERYRAHPAFLEREARIRSEQLIRKKQGRHSLRHAVGPVHFESYRGNIAPNIEPFTNWRVITWQPTSIQPKQKDWHTFPLQGGTKSYGLAHIANPENYTEHWHSRAKRQLKQWNEIDTKNWVIEPITSEEFYNAFKQAKLGLGLNHIMSRLVQYKQKYHGDRVVLFGAKHLPTGRIEAGLAVLDTPEAFTSTHLAAFHLPPARETAAGTALIDAWYKASISKNIQYLDFGVVRANTEPRDWQGFTDFKNQFLTHTIFTPKPFFRIVR